MKIIFIEPCPPEPHVYSKFKIPRLGCVLLATILRNAGHDVHVFVEEVSKIDWDIAMQADVVAISATTSTAPRSYSYADAFKQAGKVVIMGGSHVTFQVEEALEHCDLVVRNEAETIIVDLLRAIEEHRFPEDMVNVSFKKDGVIINNPVGAFIEDLDTLPIPDFNLVHGWKENSTVVSIETSRGCPFDCAFCSVIPMFGRKLRFKSAERIIEEIKYYQKTIHPRHIFFCDDNFSANPRRTKELMHRLIEEDFDLDWSAQVRVELANDPELLTLMARSNCYAVYVGFESVNPKTLELYNKKQSVAQIEKAITLFQQHNIHIHGMFVFGSDEDDVQSIYENVSFAKRMKIDSVQFLMLTPLPGTPVFRELEASGRIFNTDWSYYDGHNAVFEPARMTAYELQIETFKAMNKFYSLLSLMRYILKRDKWYTLVRIYGKYMVISGILRKRTYVEFLKKRAGSMMKKIAEQSAGGYFPIRIGIPAISVDPIHREFFNRFFRYLGIGVVFSQDKEAETSASDENLLDMLQRQIKIIRHKADIIIVPILEKANLHLSELLRTKSEQISALEPRLVLLEMDKMYKSCVELGLALGKNLIEIRRAYERALKKTLLLSA